MNHTVFKFCTKSDYPKLERKVSSDKYLKFLLQIGEKLVKPVTLQLTERLIGLQQKTEIANQCFDVGITVVQTASNLPKRSGAMYSHENQIGK